MLHQMLTLLRSYEKGASSVTSAFRLLNATGEKRVVVRHFGKGPLKSDLFELFVTICHHPSLAPTTKHFNSFYSNKPIWTDRGSGPFPGCSALYSMNSSDQHVCSKSLENPKTTVQPKHGLQSLGKVGTGRRMPPPANLPSLKSENSGNNPNISLVPSGGQGWGSTTKEKSKTEETNGNQQQSPQLQPASSLSQTTQKTSTTNTVATSGVNKTWSSVTQSQEDGGQERNFLGQQSPFFPQEFPKLAGGDVPTEGNQKSNVDSQYGPGPSLRPQTEGSWGRGTLQQQPPAGSAGGQPQSSGSGVNGPQMASDSLRDQRPYSAPRGSSISGSGIGNVPSGSSSEPPMGPVSLGHGPGMGSQMGPGSGIHPPPQYRGMMPSFMCGRNTYPSGYPSNYPNVPPPPSQQNARPSYPYSENRRQQPVRPLAEEEAYQRPAAIITEKALKGFDEILQNDAQDTWATSHGEIDYNAKLVFSDDEESPANQKKDKRDEDKPSKTHNNLKSEKDRDHKLERERSGSERENRQLRESDWSRENRSEKKTDHESDWTFERGDGFERERDERWKTWNQPSQEISASIRGMEMQRQWQAQQPPQRPFDYRGPPPQPPGSAYAAPHGRMTAGPVPLMQHGNYPPPRAARPGPRSSSVTDDDEMWRQRRKQHTEEMTMTVERARQRRAEEEKHYEQSKQSAQEKAKSFEKNDKEKDLDIDDADRSRHSSESREDKPPSRDGRERDRDRGDRSQPNYQGYNFSRQFQKNVPPRFQKQAAEYMRQQSQQPMPSNQSGQTHFMRSQSVGQTSPSAGSINASVGNSPHGVQSQTPAQMPVNYDAGWSSHPPYVNQLSGLPPPPPPPLPKDVSRQRSNSQGSATDSYESDGCPQDQSATYDREGRDSYWSRERRQQNAAGYDNWHSQSPNEGYFDQKVDSSKIYDQRHDFKKGVPEKEEKIFDSHTRETDRREKDFDGQDFRYKGRDSFKDNQKHSENREIKEKSNKSSSWANSRDYDDRIPTDPFDELHETSSRDKSTKDRNDRYERQDKERWDKERPPRPDSRDSRASRDSAKEDRLTTERNEVGFQPERDRKGGSSREEKKEKSTILDWGESPYPVESKRREWYHHPPPITPKQFESVRPPKKNLTPLRRSNAAATSSVVPDKKSESSKEDLSKKTDLESCVKKEKDAKEEKNEKIKSESATKDIDKQSEKYETHFDKAKSFNKESSKKSDIDSSSEIPKKDNSVLIDDKEKSRNDKEKHEHSTRNEQNRERRRDTRDRNVNSRSRGGNTFVNATQPSVVGGGNARYESSRGRGGNRSGAYGHGSANMPSGASVSGGASTYRGKREYRRSKVERGPRFDRQKERDKVKDDKKDKHSDDTSCSEMDDGKLGHLRQKDEDSEVSVDEASASTTESAQAEKYQNIDVVPEEEKNCIGDPLNVSKDSNIKNDKYKKDKKDVKIDSKPYDDRLKEEKGGFAPRGEPSRRGRGGGSTLSFRNSRGGTRYGPSSYGPPPSRAGFGGSKPEKLEEQKIIEENLNEDNQGDFKTNISTVENINNDFSKESSKSRSLERPQQRRPGRYEHLPPRFQKRHDRRLEKFDQSGRGRGRGRSGVYSGAGGQIIGKIGQGGKENLSDVANEEWETASESSDIAERRDRHEDRDDARKKDRDKASSASRKSFSSQRPVNESNQNRRMNNESRRGGGPNSGDRNRQRDTYRDNRFRDSGRGRQNSNFGNTGERRPIANNGNNSRPSSSAGHPGSVGRNNGRGGNPSSKTGAFQPKNEGTAAVYRVDEIKLQDPNGVQAALTDLTNRNMKAEVSIAKVPKNDKDKSGGLEGYDLNNYASVVIIDDHPEVEDDPNLLCGTDDGFQEVTSKKRHKIMVESEVKKMKKEPHARNKSGSRSRQSRLPPRFAKQRESSVKSTSVTPTTAWDMNVDLSIRSCSAKDSSPAPPSVNAWEKPINHSLRSQSPAVTSHATTSSATNTIVSSCTPVVSVDVQALSATSKSSSFDRSDQHDSGIDVSDQPASAASSQRSSPSNDCKIITPASTGKNTSEASELSNGPEIDTCKPMCTVVFENKNFKAENAVLDQFGGQNKNQPVKDASTPCESLAPGNNSTTKESTDAEEKSHCMPATFTNKESFGKSEETADMKLDFNFDSSLERLTDDKNSRNQNNNTHMPNKSLNISRTIEVTNNATPVGVQSPISPSTDDLNLKIQSVKKVWENDPPLPTVMEHPQPVSEETPSPSSYSTFTNNGDSSTNVYNSSVDTNSQTRKEQDVTEISFRESSPLQQTCSSPLVKNVDHNTSVKSHLQMTAQHNVIAGPHCPAPLSPPLMGGLEAMTGIRTIAGLASSVQVAGIPAIPSPPTVLFNSSQQMAQTGMYQPLQMDSRQTNAAAVAAAMVQFGQSPHGYPPLGTYGLSHQPPPNPQLSSAYGQQSLFVQPPAAHQGQDIYSSSQYRVQPPYPQSQHVSSNQVLGAQQNLANSHLLGSQLVQTRPAAGPSPAAPHLQSLHGLQAPQTSYFSTSAQPQTANYYHQPPTTPGSPMQQQPQYPSHQSYGSQSALNVLPQTATVNPNFRNFGGHQYKAPNNVMSNIVPDSASLRSATRSPTVDVSTNRNMFSVSTAVSTSMNSTPIAAVPPMSSSGVIGKHGQPQGSALATNRISSTTGKTSQYSITQSQQAFFQFGQQKFNHLQSNPIRPPQVLFPNVVRNAPHQQIPPVAAAAASNLHYPPPIQRPGPATVTQAAPQPQPKIGIRPQANVLVPGGKLTSAQQAKLRAEAVQQTHMFFAQSKTGKHEESVPNMLSQDKNNMPGGMQKMPMANSSVEDGETQCLSSSNDAPPPPTEGKDEKGDVPAGEE
ncbi:protein PRRC2B [Caerostris darwini]|uniref:Protein PRRC2B n=1 Tax=Caerostris darwini TaxID=1538125 RepID=A0AAV4MUC2_9ARAC|nr:protein PRRC2B [Caerostris darwini]